MQQHFRPADADEARRVIAAQACHRTVVVYFRKRTDGQDRRMVCRYFPEAADALRLRFNPAERDLLPVWDMEKGARRFISLDSVEEITWHQPDQPAATQPSPDREAARRRLEALRREMAELF